MLEYVYQLTGLFLLFFAYNSFTDHANPKRIGTGLFWLLYGVSFNLGSFMPDWIVGLIVIALTLIASLGYLGIGSYNNVSETAMQKSAQIFKNRLFLPALIVPIVTMLWKLLTGQSALIGLGVSSILALIVALVMTKCTINQSMNEGRRLIDTIGWAAILSQFLAALGYLFNQAGVGETISMIAKDIIPDGSLLIYVFAYTLSMAIFTMIMGNAFAAFAVITTGIGIPLLVIGAGGDPIIIGVVGMLSGYCGTLMTPMAANFNIVPAALLEIKDTNLVIKMQILPGICLLLANTFLIYFTAF